VNPEPKQDEVVHEYDGIQECDNQLPRWWLATFVGAIVFAAGYWAYYHNMQLGELASARHAREAREALAEEAERIQAAGEITPEMLVTLSKDVGTVEQGRETFAQTCVTCHADGARGNIGPNLTDEYWIHGGEPMAIYATVRDGFLPKQMPAWGKQLGETKVRAVVAYVLSLRNTNASGGKPPQGDKRS
jgi:cytochrome c oxidase cbb3-type subunit III